jgi:hypothetical protein
VAATTAKTWTLLCTFKEQRGIVRFLWTEGMKPVEIHHHMLAQYEQSTIIQ